MPPHLERHDPQKLPYFFAMTEQLFKDDPKPPFQKVEVATICEEYVKGSVQKISASQMTK